MEITGLYIQGAIFEQELCPTCSSSPAFSPVPTLTVAWTPLVIFFIFYTSHIAFLLNTLALLEHS